MNMKKVIFLDRDGTLNHDRGYTHKVEDYKLLEGVKEGLKRLADAGFSFVILTSQSGIGRGMYDESAYKKYVDHLLDDLKASNVHVAGVYHCPHHAEQGIGGYKVDCDCRKPKPGLLNKAEEELGPFDYKNSWSIGDAVRDLEASKAKHAGIRTILLPKNFGTEDEKKIEESDFPDYKAKNFLEAVDIILSKK